jgi:hypothetical protein
MKIFSNKNKTFKPVKSHTDEKSKKLSEFAKATLGSGNMRSAVVLPKGEDLNEWLAVNTVDFFNEISLLYGTVTEFCTPSSCPVMSAGPSYEYLWADGIRVKKPIKVIRSALGVCLVCAVHVIVSVIWVDVSVVWCVSGRQRCRKNNEISSMIHLILTYLFLRRPFLLFSCSTPSSCFFSDLAPKVSAPEYVDLLMSWVETQLNDENIFPLQLG